ncbi:hypothetical protein [Metabacillus arenae]|uniref:Uncharacterized protein n=1 Tax=Metabacillus arenae TaxID=2771434 RepID=A0A926NFI0_9BACI|nr:hypothetical protein [Metabacillus arenae]MBD1379058.1 hypothetical protein [Metabacillus arenae]
MRSQDGRISGSGVLLAFSENEESWRDYKEYNVRFPQHEEDKVYPVTTYKIGSNGELVRV